MVIQISQFLTNKLKKSEHRPLFSASPIGTPGSSTTYFNTNYRKFWQQFKQCPELVATLSIPITDILGDRPEWTDIDGEALPKEKRMLAEQYWRRNRGKEVIRSWLYDGFLTGDGFLWNPGVNKEQQATTVKEFLQQYQQSLSTKEFSLFKKQLEDEVESKTKKLDYVAASTVTIVNNEYEILYYEQNANGVKVIFSTEEIVHFRYMTLNGMVQGFSPVEALASEIVLLWLVKGNMLSFMRNGGSPDKMYILPKEIARSKNHLQLIETLRKYKTIENRHGSLVFTGEVQVEDLQGMPKDLEYKDLALYITSNFAFSFGIPVSRIPYLIGSSATKGDSGGLSESGYWNRISDFQDTIEDLLNGQIFEAMGWHIKFQRKYKQDEVREAQTASMQADTVTKYQSILAKQGKQLTDLKTLALLGFAEEDIEELDMQLLLEQSTMGQNQLSNATTMKEPDAQKKANTKSNVANSKDVGKALHHP